MTATTPVPATEDPEILRRETKKILKRHGTRRAELIPILQDVQHKLGYLPSVSLKEIAAHLEIPPVDVYGVVTFYNQFRLNPPGRHSIRVCLGTACHMKGGNIALEAWERRLGIKRELPDVDGRVAIGLWWRYVETFDLDALEKLKAYNREDVVNLRTLKELLCADPSV